MGKQYVTTESEKDFNEALMCALDALGIRVRFEYDSKADKKYRCNVMLNTDEEGIGES